MSFNIKIFESSNVIGLEEFYKIKPTLEQYSNRLGDNIGISSDWTLLLKFVLSGESSLLVAKKGVTYPSTREKEYSIVLPVPQRPAVGYGMEPKKFLSRPKLNESNFWKFDVDYSRHCDFLEFLEYTAKRGIFELFQNGFVIDGARAKIAPKIG